MITLYDYFRSSACYRVRIALNLKNLNYKTIPVHLINQGGEQLSKEYKKINPQCLVPTLQDGAQQLTQSIAIMEYLNELYPNPPLLPDSPYEKALVRSFALAIVADIHPLNNLRVLKYLTEQFHLNETTKIEWIQHWMTQGFTALEKMLTAHTSENPYCFVKQPTLADICLIPQIYNAKRFFCDLSPYPTLVRIDTHCLNQLAFQKAIPAEPVT